MQRMWVMGIGEGRRFSGSEGIEDNFVTRDGKQKDNSSLQLYLICYGVGSLWFVSICRLHLRCRFLLLQLTHPKLCSSTYSNMPYTKQLSNILT